MQSVKTQSILFEIGVEELPPHTLTPLSNQLLSIIIEQLEKAHLIDLTSKKTPQAFASPRRIGLIIEGIKPKQDNQQYKKIGPYCHLLNAAKIQFAKVCNCSPEALETTPSPKGDRWSVNVTTQGQTTAELLPPIFTQAIQSLHYKRPMYWSTLNETFIRPVRWLILMMGEKIVPMTLFGVKSDHFTYAHRAYYPNPICVNPHSYEQVLAQHQVIADSQKRLAHIQSSIQTLLQTTHNDKIKALNNNELLTQINDINEQPTAYLGKFDPHFLKLPDELLTMVMTKHQRYIPLQKNNTLINQFIFFSNVSPQQPTQMIHDHQKVLHARFSDAKFFFEQDQKQPLYARLDALKNIQFFDKLGNYFDKTKRLEKVMAQLFQDPQTQTNAKLAATLSQCDLTTEVVTEFPELAGIMGRYYAKCSDHNDMVCQAIAEQYQPKTAEDEIPQTEIGAKLALVQKIDHLFQLTQIGKHWSSSTKDPFGLRRDALGIIKLLLNSPYLTKISLDQLLILAAKSAYYPTQNIQHDSLANFFSERLKNYLKTHTSSSIVLTALSSYPLLEKPLAHITHTINAIEAYQTQDPDQLLMIQQQQKRLKNIIKSQKITDQPVSQASHPIEQQLQLLLNQAKPLTTATDHIHQLYLISKQIEHWFDEVKITQGSHHKINNRLYLIKRIIEHFKTIGEFEHLKIPAVL